MSGHDTPFHPGHEPQAPAIASAGLSDVTEPLPENVQDAAITQLGERLAAVQHRRAKLVSDFQALEQRIASYEANHGNL